MCICNAAIFLCIHSGLMPGEACYIDMRVYAFRPTRLLMSYSIEAPSGAASSQFSETLDIPVTGWYKECLQATTKIVTHYGEVPPIQFTFSPTSTSQARHCYNENKVFEIYHGEPLCYASESACESSTTPFVNTACF